MPLSKSLFRTSKKIMKSAIKDLKPSVTSKRTPAKKTSTDKKCDLADLYDEFESKYSKTCERMEHKVYSVDTDSIDPDKNVAAFKKMLDLAHELEDFCSSHGQGGVEYFKENYSDIYREIQGDLDSYLSNEYKDAKEFFEEFQAKKKAVKSLSNKIVKSIQQADSPIPQTELKKTFSENELSHYNAAIKELTEAGKIEKIKIGSRVFYKIK